MRRGLVAVVALALAPGCAAAVGAPGPGGSGLERVRGPSTYVDDPDGDGYGYVHYDPGFVHVADGGVSFVFGAKIGVTRAGFGARDAVTGLGSEPHLDLTYVPRSDRWALTGTLGWVFQTLTYDDDVVKFSGFAPSVTMAVAVRRRFYVHAGGGGGIGNVSVTPEGDDYGTSARAYELRGLGGFTFVFRRTPNIDMAFRLEGNLYRSTEVMIEGERGAMSGYGATFEMILSGF
jgi:hypothetical protein